MTVAVYVRCIEKGPGWVVFQPGVPAPLPGELVLNRFTSLDPSYGSGLWATLRSLGVDTLVVCGVSTTLAVEGTVRGAANRGLRSVVVADCCTSVPQAWHDFSVANVLPLLASVVSADEVCAAINPGLG